MHYLTNYYKNLCEQLQERINILEAGYAKAIRSGDREKMEKELARQRYLEKFKEELSDKGIEIGTENFDVLDPEVQRLMNPSPATRMARVIARIGVEKEDKEGKKHPTPATRMARVIARIGVEKEDKEGKKHPTGIQGHRKNMEDLAMQLDSEYPQPKSRIRVAELPAESPFGSDLDISRHVTPQQY